VSSDAARAQALEAEERPLDEPQGPRIAVEGPTPARPGGPVESELHALLAAHDKCWRELDAPGMSALWDPQSATVTYFGDECRDPLIGQSHLHQHYTRMFRRLTDAEMHSELVATQALGPDAATLMARMKWTFAHPGQPPTSGTSWVGATVVRTAAGWRFVQYVERLTQLDLPALPN
jgi:uncharacterized protein (TIGR02246 family)